ncbi:MAG TPA: hypothetical protein VMZ28_06830 [Kofleriaceae bacterium]|nr:hypothetical protein [Kofleriaceae bacterium]
MQCHQCHAALDATTSISDASSTSWCFDCAAKGLRKDAPAGGPGCSKPGCGEPLTDVTDRIDFGVAPDGQAWHKGCAQMELARL